MSHKAFRYLRSTLLIVITVLLLIAIYQYFFPSPPRVELPEEMPITNQDRVLVVAPHADDETLGAGGLIQRAHQEGAQVKVVIITNGDGFTFAAAGEGRTLRPTSADYIRLAYQRQHESLAALSHLGLPAQNLIFLGYPDRGLAPMWDTNWSADNPYWSRFTQSDRSPYANSYSPEAVHCGQSLGADLSKILVDFQPTILVLPHPNDAHSDHWAAFNFVTFTLSELRSRKHSFASTIREYGYLVHRGDWPAPKGLLPARELLPPAPMLYTSFDWFKFPLGETGAWSKYLAILKYQSQVNYMRRYLVSFARANELFAPIRSRSATLVPPSWEAAYASDAAWQEIDPVIKDPRSDTLTRRVFSSADLRSLRVATDGTTLFLRLETHHPVASQTQYRINLRPLHGGVGSPPSESSGVTSGHVTSGHGVGLQLLVEAYGAATVREAATAWHELPVYTSEEALQINIPLDRLGYPSIVFVSAESRLFGTVDRLAWTLLQLPSRETEPLPYDLLPLQKDGIPR